MPCRPVSRAVRPTPSVWRLVLAGILAAAGCGDSEAPLEPPVAPGGVIEVQVVQSGMLLNRVLGVKVDGVERPVVQNALAEGGAWDKVFVALGTHEVELTGVAPNCRVDGGTRVTAKVSRMEAAKIVFHLRCTADGLLAGRKAAFTSPAADDGWGNSRLYLIGEDGVARSMNRDVYGGGVAMAPAGDRLAARLPAGNWAVLDATNAVLSPSLFPQGVDVMAVAWSPGGDAIAGSLWDGERCRVMIAEGAGWATHRELGCGEQGYPLDIDWAPGGDRLAILRSERDIGILDTRTGQMTALPSISPIKSAIAIAWSPDGGRLAIAEAEAVEAFEEKVRLFLYDVATGTLRKQWEMPTQQTTIGGEGPYSWSTGAFQWWPDGSAVVLGVNLFTGPPAQSCRVLAVVPIADPANWRPLLPCGVGIAGFSMPRGPLAAAETP